MKILRWIMLIPTSGTIAAVAWEALHPNRSYYSTINFWYAVGGMWQLVLSNLAALLIFVITGASIAPDRRRIVASSLALLGALFSFPLTDPEFLTYFDLFGWASRALGGFLGVIIVFWFLGRSSKSPEKCPTV